MDRLGRRHDLGERTRLASDKLETVFGALSVVRRVQKHCPGLIRVEVHTGWTNLGCKVERRDLSTRARERGVSNEEAFTRLSCIDPTYQLLESFRVSDTCVNEAIWIATFPESKSTGP